jgi:hypothetical protein
MITWLLSAFDTVRAIRQDTEMWVHQLTGEGPSTLRRQRETVEQALPTGPPAPRSAPSAYPKSGHSGMPTRTARRRRPALTVR